MPPKKSAKKTDKKSPQPKPAQKVWTVTVRSKDGPPEDLEVFYDRRNRSYWYKVSGRYDSYGVTELKMHLRSEGLSDNSKAGPYFNGQLEIDWPMWNAMRERAVDYAGALSGHRVGVFGDGSNRKFLVTDEAAGVWDAAPKKLPKPEFFFAFIQELLPDDQWQHFCYWLAFALRTLQRRDFSPGQVAVFAGPGQCGKSLIQMIITEVLGGRSANPWSYMKGEKFNYDLAGAEHWMIEDPDSTPDTRSRISLGNRLKECANNEQFNIHQKNKDALSLPLFRRITLSINDEPEFLMLLPPMDKSVRDKISLYKCSPATKSLKQFIGMEGEFARAKVKDVVRSEVPNIRAFLLRNFESIPSELRDNRCGIVAHHNGELMDELTKMMAEVRLLEVIDQVLFMPPSGLSAEEKTKWQPEPWTGKATELEVELKNSALAHQTVRAMNHMGQIGAYLGKLAKSHAHRVSKKVIRGFTHWTITTPLNEPEQTTKD